MSDMLCDPNNDLRQYNVFDTNPNGVYCPAYAPFFGVLGCSTSMFLCAVGAAYGTAKCGSGLACMAVQYPKSVLRNIIPIVMASVIAIYGLVASVLIVNGMSGAADGYPIVHGYADLAAGLTVGISGVATGWATAITGELGVRAVCHQPKYFVGMLLTLIFAGVMGLYGLIVALTLKTSVGSMSCFADCYNPCCREFNFQCTIDANECKPE
eukprot:m.332201 g.332201  ORF g.332201 m.332201 type:complete len:211 (+) comp16897_c0_seq1:71-703(+)